MARLPQRRTVKRVGVRVAIACAVVATALAGVLLGLRVAGPERYDTDLGEVRLEVDPSWSGEVDAYIPIADWGIRANAFSAPVKLRGEVRSVDRTTVVRVAGGSEKSLRRARDQLDDAAASAFLRAGAFGVSGAALAGLVAALALAAVRRPPRRTLALAAGAVFVVGALAVAGSLWSARTTFDPDAFERPRFYARGAELLQLLEAANHSDERAERYRSKVEGTLVRLSDLLATSGVGDEPLGAGEGGPGRRALLASDLHANNLVVGALAELAAPGNPVFFVGDFGHAGSEAEARVVAPRLQRLGSRVIAVSGNHDSTALMRRLASVGVTVLTTNGRLGRNGQATGPRVIEVLGLRVAGYSDPLEWQGTRPNDPDRIFSYTEMDDGDARRDLAKDRLVGWFDRLTERPDVVLVHQNALAQHLAATVGARPGHRPLVILTGHDHKQHVDRHGKVVVVDAGSAGAGGVLGVGDERVAVGEMRFAGAAPGLRAVDLIEVDPFEGGAQAQRVIVAGNECEDDEPTCTLSP